MIVLLLGALALAAPARAPFTLAGTLAAGVSPPSVGVIGALHAAWQPGWMGIELTGREGYWSADQRIVSTIGLSVRIRMTPAVFAHAGLAHQHEAPLALMREQPIGAAAGTAAGLLHRSGFQAGLGAEVPLPIGSQQRWRWRIELGASLFPDPHGQQVQGWLEQGIALDIGKRRGDPDSFRSPGG